MTKTSGAKLRSLSSQFQKHTITTWAAQWSTSCLKLTGNVSEKSGHEEIRCNHKNDAETPWTGYEQKPEERATEGRSVSAPCRCSGLPGSGCYSDALRAGFASRRSPPASEQPVQGK